MDTQNLMGEDFSPNALPSSDEKNIAMLTHILGLVSSFIGPLVVYLIKKDESAFIAEHAREALNFQLTVFLLYIVSGILVILLVGLLMLWALSIVNLILVIVAVVKTSDGKLYRYPFSLRLIK